MRKALITTALVSLVLTAPASARPTGENGHVIDVEVLGGWREGDAHIAGLKLILAPGWKTYWRAPGDAGIPPHFDWSGSQNVATITPHFPVPEIFSQNGMRSIGYHDEVVFPLLIAKRDAGGAVHLKGEVELGVCQEICIPAFVSIDAVLPAQGASDTDIARALADRPLTESEASVGPVTCSVSPTADGLSLTMTVDMPPMARGEAAAIETADPTVWVAEPRVTRNGDSLTATTELVRYNDTAFFLNRSGVRMTVFGAGGAVDIQGCDPG